MVGLMNTRLSQLNEKLRDIRNSGAASNELIQNFNARSQLLRRGIVDALMGSVLTVGLMVELFIVSLFRIAHAYGAALLFAFAAVMLGIGLIRFVQEARLALQEGHLYGHSQDPAGFEC